MGNEAFKEFQLRVNIRASREQTYGAWTTPGGLESWFLRSARFTGPDGNLRKREESVQKGDMFEWRWHGHPDEVVQKGKVLEANGKDTFAFTFSKESPVRVEMRRESGELLVELTESELPTDEETLLKHYMGDSNGWTFYLANLKSVLEGGLDLRNTNQNIKDVITA